MIRFVEAAEWAQEPLLFSERVAEVAAVAVRAGVAGENHAADLGLVPGVPDHRTQLGYPVRELAVVAVGALPGLLPLVAQLCFEHPLVVHVELQRLLLSLSSWHVHSLLLCTFHTHNQRIGNETVTCKKLQKNEITHWPLTFWRFPFCGVLVKYVASNI